MLKGTLALSADEYIILSRVHYQGPTPGPASIPAVAGPRHEPSESLLLQVEDLLGRKIKLQVEHWCTEIRKNWALSINTKPSNTNIR